MDCVYACKWIFNFTIWTATYLPSYAFINSVVKGAPSDTVGKATLCSSFKYLICLLPLARALSFIVSYFFLSIYLHNLKILFYPWQSVYPPWLEKWLFSQVCINYLIFQLFNHCWHGREELYRNLPPPREPISVQDPPFPFSVYDSIPGDEEIAWEVRMLCLNLPDSPSGMRAEHLRQWLISATQDDSPDATNWLKVVAIMQAAFQYGTMVK